jgi:hypothetical protein
MSITRSLTPHITSEDNKEVSVYDNNSEQLLFEILLNLRKISFYQANMVDFDINNQDIDEI